MAVSGTSLSLFGRSAIPNAAGARSSQRVAPARVEPTDPIKDPTSREYRALQELKVRDREVRQHEQAHVVTGGQRGRSGPTFSYERGPGGRQYATGGEVEIDSAPVTDDPAETIRKMQVVRGAALAPDNPYPQDRAVAAEATRTEAEARVELREEQQAKREAERQPSPDSERNAVSVRRAGPALDAYRFAEASGTRGTSPTPALDLIA